jgi:hypothetical protein
VKALDAIGTLTAKELNKAFAEHEIEIIGLVGGSIDISMELERGTKKEGPVAFDDVFALVNDSLGSILGHLDSEIAKAASEFKKESLIRFRNLLANVGGAIEKAQRDVSPVARKKAIEGVQALVDGYAAAKTKFGIEDMPLNAFMDMLQETLTTEEPPTITSSMTKKLFAWSSEEESKGLSLQDAIETAADILMPEIEGIYNRYIEGINMAKEDLLGTVEETIPMQELELAYASEDNPNNLDCKANTVIIAPISPNDMYSSYDLSENNWELKEENGKKKLIINKDLKNLVTKRMNEFLKGAFQEGDVVNVDFGNSIATGTVQAYLGDKMYKVAVFGSTVTVPEVNLFKI